MNFIKNRYFNIKWEISGILFFLFLIGNTQQVKADDFQQKTVFQSEREIPIVKTIDVLIIGGTVPAVAAAVAAAKNGASVFLIESKPYLGEDMCSTLRMVRISSEKSKTKIEKQIFGNSNTTTPMRVKGVLSKSLTDAGVEFVFGSFVTDIIWNEKNKPTGVVIANRSGRQAIVAKTIIDASKHATVCRMAGAEFKPWISANINFERIIALSGNSDDEPIYKKHILQILMPDLSFASFAKAEQKARKETYIEGQLRASESLFFISPNPLVCKKNEEEWSDSYNKSEHFQVEKFDKLFVLSDCAGIPRNVAELLLQPGAMASIGEKIGNVTSQIAKTSGNHGELKIKPIKSNSDIKGNVKETLKGFRVINEKNNSITSPQTGIPVIGTYDIVVIGGGTSGAPAAISAARMGMKVLVVEYLEGLGGIGTLGMIGKPYHGKKVGFAAEVPFPKDNIEPKMEWYRSELEKAGADIWLGAIGCGAYLEGKTIKGAIIATHQGRGVVKAKVIIDATGNADVAISAGVDYRYGTIEQNQIAIQGTGFSSRNLKGNYNNSDYLLVDESDILDVWRSLVSVHITKNNENQYDAVPLPQNRERRRVVGDFTLNYLDQIAGRTYPDGIVFSGSDYDSHGYPTSLYFALLPHDEISKKENHPAPGGTCYTPYRCLLPKNLNGILVIGLGISMDRDASAMVRMQFDMSNQGYAAGIAASMAITEDIGLREINIKELQKLLVEKGNLSKEVLKMKDNYPFSKKIIKQAVLNYGAATNPENGGHSLAVILSHKEKAIPIIQKEYKKAKGKTKLLYAQTLGICGNSEGVPTLIAELNRFENWDEKIFQGSMADFAHLPTPIDGIILALGYSNDKSVLPELLKMVEKLNADVTLSHHRSMALAIEKISASAASESLFRLLKKPGMQDHAILNLEDALNELGNDGKGKTPVKNSSLDKRTKALREIILARALYKCGDYNGLGKSILEGYQKDMRGLFARHANQILKPINIKNEIKK